MFIIYRGYFSYFGRGEVMAIRSGSTRESGNIFFALFGAVALVGILGAGVMTFMKGPLATSVKITRINTAQTQMALGAQVAVMASANTATSGDCDSDGFVEPLEWRDAGAVAHPTGGGLIPMSIGISKKDPWGTEYGYCSWDNGTYQAAGCNGVAELRLQGGTGAAASSYPVVAIISAGRDKTFTTTCRNFSVADVNGDGDLLDSTDLPLVSKAVETDDDIIFTYSYDEATGASGGLWSIKSGAPDTAVISKKIEAQGVANLQGGILLPDSGLMPCDPTTAGVMARNVSGGIDICNGTTWEPLSGGADTFNTDNTIACDAATAGQVRYNTTTSMPEFCDGTQWITFAFSVPGINLVITPQQRTDLDVDGQNNIDPSIAGVCDDMIWNCGNAVVFTVTNTGTDQSSVLAYTLSNTTNFYLSDETCTVAGGNADGKLDANESCAFTIIPKADGNYRYNGNLDITVDNTPFAILQGTANGFGCQPGRQGGGGIYADCGLSDPDTGTSYDLIVMPGGCNGSTNNPTCTGGTDSVTKQYGGSCCTSSLNPPGYWSETFGAKVNVSLVASQSFGYTAIYPAVSYCMNMNYNGYDDWYLPARQEMANSICLNKAAIGGFASAKYWAAGNGSSSDAALTNLADCSWTGAAITTYLRVRCARRENIALPDEKQDTDPNNVTGFPFAVTTVSGNRTASKVQTFTGFLQPAVISVTGDGNVAYQYSIDNGATWSAEATSGTLPQANIKVRIMMDAPTVAGTKHTATLEVGSVPDIYTWELGYADASAQGIVFVTNSVYGGSIGGLAGADSKCQSNATAAGYSGTWKAILSDSTTNAINRVPWNWGTLLLPTGTVVANSWSDLWDGSIQNPINVTQYGATKNILVFSNSLTNGERKSTSPSNLNCNDWNWPSSGGSSYPYVGTSSASSSVWIDNGKGYYNCSGGSRALSLYCMSENPGVDNTPSAPNSAGQFAYQVQVADSTLITSNAVTVAGLSFNATPTVTISGSDGSPSFEVSTDGGSTWAAGISGVTTVQNDDKIRLRMTSSAVAGEGYMMTIKVGSGNTVPWRVFTGDPTGGIVKRVFVTSGTHHGNYAGVLGADSFCQSQASAAALGGTWKAILSGITEPEAAINRIGYNWSTLTLIDGTTVVSNAGALWDGSIDNPITLDQYGTSHVGVAVQTNTKTNGWYKNTTSQGDYNCYNWTSNSSGGNQWNPHIGLTSMVGTQWIDQGLSSYCSTGLRLYCVEQ